VWAQRPKPFHKQNCFSQSTSLKTNRFFTNKEPFHNGCMIKGLTKSMEEMEVMRAHLRQWSRESCPQPAVVEPTEAVKPRPVAGTVAVKAMPRAKRPVPCAAGAAEPPGPMCIGAPGLMAVGTPGSMPMGPIGYPGFAIGHVGGMPFQGMPAVNGMPMMMPAVNGMPMPYGMMPGYIMGQMGPVAEPSEPSEPSSKRRRTVE
jgi:hypothetical protein